MEKNLLLMGDGDVNLELLGNTSSPMEKLICVKMERNQQLEMRSCEENVLVSDALVPDFPEASFTTALLDYLKQ